MTPDKSEKEEIILNGKIISDKEFEKKKKNLSKKKGVSIVETSENSYKTRIQG